MTSPRPRWLLPLALAGLLGGALAVSTARCSDGPAGRLVASVEVLDFGPVRRGDEPVRIVRVRNESQRSVVLTAAVPSCACLVVDPSFRRSLMPGEETEMKVTLASGLVPPQKLERKYLEVRSDDPKVPVLMVLLRGEIVEPVTVEPTIVRVDPGDAAGRGEPKRLRIRAAAGFSARVTDCVLTQPEWFTVEPQAVKDGVDVVLTVKADPARRGGVNSLLTMKIEVQGPGFPTQIYTKHVNIQGTW